MVDSGEVVTDEIKRQIIPEYLVAAGCWLLGTIMSRNKKVKILFQDRAACIVLY